MSKLWQGDLHGALDSRADDFNSSIRFDSRMYAQDIRGSIAHATMLGSCGIISVDDADAIIAGLQSILADIESGALAVDMQAEDIHSFIEQELCSRIGDAGKRLHTARSRNDQVAVDLRLYLADETDAVIALLKDLLRTISDKAEAESSTIMPGYTHLQRAQPVTFAHYICAYGMSFARDIERLQDAKVRLLRSPLGACALAGTGFPTDRGETAALLGMNAIALNSMDAVSDRDYCVELAAALSLIMTHLSRFSEELILWSSSEFAFIRLSDAYTTGSSIMPQKKNPDMAELTRGKTGRVYGSLITLLTMLKGIPLAYNKDMQEDKEAIFDCFDTVKACLTVFAPMLETAEVLRDNMLKASRGGFINATDLADYLTAKGIAFRDAYRISGDIVAYCIREAKVLEDLTLEEYRSYNPIFDEGVYEAVDIYNCLCRRNSAGGASPEQIPAQLAYLRGFAQ